MDVKKLATMLIGSMMVVIIMLLMDNSSKNPIIGKWRSETIFPAMGKVTNIIEFKKDSVEMEGIVYKVHYDVQDKKVIVMDEKGSGTVYEMIDRHTMKSTMMGIETVYKKIGN
jgi:hypothetical protein